MGKRPAPAPKMQKAAPSPAPKRGKKEKKPQEPKEKEKDDQKSEKKKDPPIPPFSAVGSKDVAAFFNVDPNVLVPHATHAQKKARFEEDLCQRPLLSSEAGSATTGVSEQAASTSAGGSATNAALEPVPVNEHPASSGVCECATSGLVLSKWGDYAVPGEGGPVWTCDRADPEFHRIYKQCREHRLFAYYMMAIHDTHDPRSKDNAWCWTYNDPVGELHDFNKYMVSNGYDPYDISNIPWKKNTGETKEDNAVVGETVEQMDPSILKDTTRAVQDAPEETLAAIIAEVADVPDGDVAVVQKDSDAQNTEASSTKDGESTEVAAAGEAIEQTTTSKASDGTFAGQSLSGAGPEDSATPTPEASSIKDVQSADDGEAVPEAIDGALAVQSLSAAGTSEQKSSENLEQDPADATVGKVVDEYKETTEVPLAKTEDDDATEVATEVVPELENTGKRTSWTLDRLLEMRNLADMMKETCELSVLGTDEFESVMSDIRAHPKYSEVVKRLEDEAHDALLPAKDQWRFGINAEDIGEDIESWCETYFDMHSSSNQPPQGRVATMSFVS